MSPEIVESTQASVMKHRRTIIPNAIRKRHHIEVGDTLLWFDDGESIRVVPVPRDPIAALRGIAKGEGLLEKLLAERTEERQKF